MTLHPDDVLFFHEVAAAMRRVAKAYQLPLRDVHPTVDPDYSTSALGTCAYDGTIHLTLRGMRDGVWDDEPRHEQDVWETAAHELAHLRHMNHGVAFQEFEQEMLVAVRNQQSDHREKVLARLVKMQASRDGEAALGNMDAAEAFAAAINRMLIEYELHPSDVDYARVSDDPVVELRVDLEKYRIAAKRIRVAWQESLARVVARAHLCSFLICTGTNSITFVGTRSHATVAEYVYGTLVPAVVKLQYQDYHAYYVAEHKQGRRVTPGFAESWYGAFITRITQRFEDARRAAVAAVPDDVPGAQTQALIRLDGALAKVRQYVDHKFARKRRYVSALGGVGGVHAEGRAMGRAAADKVVIGRRGVTGGAGARRLLN